ncbi:unnamed protein product [Soboliphyme baturini]|uniref:ZP domain-containing protein n=1 Tax=Soboliphyme baturini TaxID=241478 RepID=A0A183IHT0_9BILA|nr:unnamed protein product [Soboliphyme baturini]
MQYEIGNGRRTGDEDDEGNEANEVRTCIGVCAVRSVLCESGSLQEEENGRSEVGDRSDRRQSQQFLSTECDDVDGSSDGGHAVRFLAFSLALSVGRSVGRSLFWRLAVKCDRRRSDDAHNRQTTRSWRWRRRFWLWFVFDFGFGRSVGAAASSSACLPSLLLSCPRLCALPCSCVAVRGLMCLSCWPSPPPRRCAMVEFAVVLVLFATAVVAVRPRLHNQTNTVATSPDSLSFYFSIRESNSPQSVPWAKYPHTLLLGRRIYVDVKMTDARNAQPPDPDFRPLPKECYFTRTSSPANEDKYLLITAGCPSESSVILHYGDRSEQKSTFSVEPQRLYFAASFMFLHCKATVCSISGGRDKDAACKPNALLWLEFMTDIDSSDRHFSARGGVRHNTGGLQNYSMMYHPLIGAWHRGFRRRLWSRSLSNLAIVTAPDARFKRVSVEEQKQLCELFDQLCDRITVVIRYLAAASVTSDEKYVERMKALSSQVPHKFLSTGPIRPIILDDSDISTTATHPYVNKASTAMCVPCPGAQPAPVSAEQQLMFVKGLTISSVFVISSAAFVVGMLLMGGMWYIYEVTKPNKGEKQRRRNAESDSTLSTESALPNTHSLLTSIDL